MITKEKFIEIQKEVEVATNELFKKFMTTDWNAYFLLLNSCVKKDGKIIFDRSSDLIRDNDRFSFFKKFLQNNYAFGNEVQAVDDNLDRIFIEMMIYTHIWESKYFINRLAQMANVISGGLYDLEILNKHPYSASEKENGKKDDKLWFYITQNIKTKFIDAGLKIGEIFPKLYHSQIRNAFAHSDFYYVDNKIVLSNYNNQEKHSIESLTFDDFSNRFCYTVLFHFLFEKKFRSDFLLIKERSPNNKIKIEEEIYISIYDKISGNFNLTKHN